MRSQFPDAVVLPGATSLPTPSGRRKVHRPPVSLPAIGVRLARGVLHQLRKEDPAHHQRPQLNVATQDARWFLLCRVDGVTVTTADGRGVVYRQRDRAQMFDLLRTSLRQHLTLARKFKRMRRVYREAMPVLTSKQKWETVLLAGAEVSSR
jgi:galactofuranosylgalactofuranosylrhamnosyl-N-acetylglucosaminyl-diphospho-decaprenol beta-1,5/1,6-galactofuranosyltransferase